MDNQTFKITLKDRILMMWYWTLSMFLFYYSHANSGRSTDKLRIKKQEKYIWRLLMDNDIEMQGSDAFCIGDLKFDLDLDGDLIGVIINNRRYHMSRSIEVLSRRKYKWGKDPKKTIDEESCKNSIVNAYVEAKGL